MNCFKLGLRDLAQSALSGAGEYPSVQRLGVSPQSTYSFFHVGSCGIRAKMLGGDVGWIGRGLSNKFPFVGIYDLDLHNVEGGRHYQGISTAPA